ncbi:ATP-binding protein [Actibacterium sp. 188UL27-1]|uniref:hybrid sensor histidine kinase/response regulator n=1 Tax=Actibacterium sp. 188UL27-1 TaxID=2786961 RepID=UPI00195E1B6A|nr:ATP-binding protein [Actibacterium sp. 188UL27-1]MBM7069370.1 response regulator [Actibacterium sp. 188UL27-1]
MEFSPSAPFGPEHRALEAFEWRRSPAGKLQTYCRRRVEYAWIRCAIILVCGGVVFWFGGAEMAVLTVAIAAGGEALDWAVLRYLARTDVDQNRLPLRKALTCLLAGCQAIAASVAWVIMNGAVGPGGLFFASAICLGLILDAASYASVNRAATATRLSIFLSLLLASFYGHWVEVADAAARSALLLDMLSVLILISFGWLFLHHRELDYRRRNAAQHEQLKKGEQLVIVNRLLADTERQTRQMAMAVEQASDSVAFTDPDGRIFWVNGAFEQMMGYDLQQVAGRAIEDFVATDTDPAELDRLAQARISRTAQNAQLAHICKGGDRIWLSTNLTPLLDKTGSLMAVVVVQRDVTASKEREAALAQAREHALDVAKAKDAFLATISHELRTPMNAIIATCDMLRETPMTTDQDGHVQMISVAGEALLAIINDVLDFSKLEAGKLDISANPFSPGDCVAGAVQLLTPLADQKGLSLFITLPPDLPKAVIGDDGRLRQVLLNLIGNAIKFTDAGSIQVTVSGQVVDREYRATFTVADTGLGISADRIDHVFDAFTQADASISRRFGGTGLGLSIVKRLVQAMGGEVAVHSQMPGGSTFTIDLSFAIAAAQVTAPHQPMAALPASLHILVADDNRTNRLLLQRMLEPMGITITQAADGAEAVAAFVDTPPDLVLMDMSMPEMNGLDATIAIRQYETHAARERCPIIALTANAFAEDRQSCLSAGMDDHLAKPIRKVTLVNAILAQLPAPTHNHRSAG